MDPQMLTGAAIAAVSFLVGLPVGVALTVARVRRRTPDGQPRPICGCTHSKGEHEDTTGPCLSEVARPYYHDNGDRNGHQWVPCSCARYVGPEPLTELYATPRYLPEKT